MQCAVTHYARSRRQPLKYSNDICDILLQNSWETRTFWFQGMTIIFYLTSFQRLFIDMSVQISWQFMIVETSICILESWPQLRAGKCQASHYADSTQHESKERQRSALLTFTCTLWWIEILHTSTALLLFKCEQNVQNITKTHLWNMG